MILAQEHELYDMEAVLIANTQEFRLKKKRLCN